MIDYTERISLLMHDIVARVPRLSYIDPADVLVFGRYGRTGAEGAFATCHCISLPTSEPGYYYWRDRQSGKITRRSQWFITKSPTVSLAGRPINYLLSFTLPRFCDQTLRGSRKACFYNGVPDWMAKLDTVIHELYHIDPDFAGIRKVEHDDGRPSSSSHGRAFLANVAEMLREYLATRPDPDTYSFLKYSFAELEARCGGVLATTFRTFPSFPQRYIEVLPPSSQPAMSEPVRIEPLKLPIGPKHFTERDLVSRQFLERTTRSLVRRDLSRQLRPEGTLLRQLLPEPLLQVAAANQRGS